MCWWWTTRMRLFLKYYLLNWPLKSTQFYVQLCSARIILYWAWQEQPAGPAGGQHLPRLSPPAGALSLLQQSPGKRIWMLFLLEFLFILSKFLFYFCWFLFFQTMDDLAFKDIGGSLESLEISFGLLMRIFPESALKPLQKLLWLSLDNNEIEEMSETSLYSLGELQYLNLEANKLHRQQHNNIGNWFWFGLPQRCRWVTDVMFPPARIPANLFHKNVHKNLRDVRLSFNKLRVVRTGQFSRLARLQTAVLTGNLLKAIHTHIGGF